MSDSRVYLHQRDKGRSKLGVSACELDGKGGEDELEVAPVLEVS